METLAFRVAERFSPEVGASWTKYIQWSGLTQLKEVVGLDPMLCPSTFGTLADADWNHLVFGEEIGDCFDSSEYLAGRVSGRFDDRRHQFLAIAREPTESAVEAVRLPGFRFMGFELLDEDSSASALTNCGGFAAVFDNAQLSVYGLVSSAVRAYAIRDSLAVHYPDERHAQCVAWAVWRRETA